MATAPPDDDDAKGETWLGQSPDLESGPADVDWIDSVGTGVATIDRNGFGMGLNTRTTATGGGSCWPPAPTGIRVGEPGFGHVRIEPKPTHDLEWAGGRVETVRRFVESSLKLTKTPGEGREGHGIALDVTVPGNATATVEIPRLGADNVRVREGGTNV